MAVSTQDRRRAAQSMHWAPLHPGADNKQLNGSDRRMVIGVYPGSSLYVSGSATGVSEVQGELGFLISLAGSSDAVSDAAASLLVATQLAGSSDAVSDAAASLLVATQLAGSSDAVSDAAASLLVATQLAALSAATSTATAALLVATQLAGRTTAVSSAAAILAVQWQLIASSDAVSSVTVALLVARRTIRFYERTANQITSYFQGIADTNSFVVRFDNDPRTTPADDVWYLASVDFGVANQHELGTTTAFRVVGNFSIRSQDILGAGASVLLENSDTITAAFRNIDVGRITFGVPRINNTGRIGDNFQINITCPFFADKQPRN